MNYAATQEKATLAKSKRIKAKTERETMILRLVEKNGYIVRKDVEAELNVSQATAILILRNMIEKGLLMKEGFGKHLKYCIAE